MVTMGPGVDGPRGPSARALALAIINMPPSPFLNAFPGLRDGSEPC